MTRVPAPVEIVVDAANVMGSRPDGWWRDRAGAAIRLLQALAVLPGQVLPDGAPDGAGSGPRQVARVLAVVEGQARRIPEVEGVSLVRSTTDGDSAVVQTCRSVLEGGGVPLAVTADRGLRARLPAGTLVAGPRWLLNILDGHPGTARTPG